MATDQEKAVAQDYLLALMSSVQALVRSTSQLVEQQAVVMQQQGALIEELQSLNASMFQLQQQIERLADIQQQSRPSVADKLRDTLAPRFHSPPPVGVPIPHWRHPRGA